MKLFSAPPSVHARRARNGNGHCICFTILKRQLLAETKMSRIGDSRLDWLAHIQAGSHGQKLVGIVVLRASADFNGLLKFA